MDHIEEAKISWGSRCVDFKADVPVVRSRPCESTCRTDIVLAIRRTRSWSDGVIFLSRAYTITKTYTSYQANPYQNTHQPNHDHNHKSTRRLNIVRIAYDVGALLRVGFIRTLVHHHFEHLMWERCTIHQQAGQHGVASQAQVAKTPKEIMACVSQRKGGPVGDEAPGATQTEPYRWPGNSSAY